MSSSAFIILTDLAQDKLWHQFEYSHYYKWSTVCLLRYLNYSTLDCMIILPHTSPVTIKEAINTFAFRYNLQNILIRTDGGLETGNYIKGGNSLHLNAAFSLCNKISYEGRALILMTPTIRFNNLLSINMGINRSGSLTLEILGPGFDISDINRGFIKPEISINVTNIDWEKFEYINPMFISFSNNSDQIEKMKELRLERIYKELLPILGINLASVNSTKEWLIKNSYTGLFQSDRPQTFNIELKRWYEDAFIISKAYGKKFEWDNLCISVSHLSKERGFIYWDILNSNKKFVI